MGEPFQNGFVNGFHDCVLNPRVHRLPAPFQVVQLLLDVAPVHVNVWQEGGVDDAPGRIAEVPVRVGVWDAVVPKNCRSDPDGDVLDAFQHVAVLLWSDVRVRTNAGRWNGHRSPALPRDEGGWPGAGPFVKVVVETLGGFEASRIRLKIVGERHETLDGTPLAASEAILGTAVKVRGQRPLDGQ